MFQFHAFLLSGYHNILVNSLMNDISDLNHRARVLAYQGARIEETLQEHLRIIEALLERDIQGAEASLARHLANGKMASYK